MHIDQQPSFTALTAAAARAAHLIVDREPVIFADTMAEAMLGERAEELLGFHRQHGTHPVLAGARAQVTCRSRYTEDSLAAAVRRGSTQYVILGAGLDSFASRSPLAGRVRVFEIDHPATQAYKQRITTAAGNVSFIPVDFGRDSLHEGLDRAGFDFGAPAFAAWLGVTMYLEASAIERTLAVLGGFAPGSEIVADYVLPAGLRDAAGEDYARQVGQAAAERGEPWISLFSPGDMAARLARNGFGPVRDVRQCDMISAAAWDRTDALRPAELSRIAHASIPDRGLRSPSRRCPDVGQAGAARDQAPGAADLAARRDPAPAGPARGHRPAAEDQAHRRADDGEPLLRQLPGHADRTGRGPAGRRRRCPGDRQFRAERAGVSRREFTTTLQHDGNPTQSWHASHLQYNAGANDGFSASVARTLPAGADPAVPLGYWTERELPFYYGLARTFPLADRWFCSCLGPTFPNRRFLIAGTAHGLIDDLAWDVVDYPEAGTIFDALATHGISWVNYHNVRPVSVLLRRLLGGRVLVALRRLAQLGQWVPRVLNTAVGNKSFTADVYPLGLARAVLHLRTARQFLADAAAGTLPAVSIVDPDFGRFSEENPQDISLGESFAADVIKAVMDGPGWPHTLLIWTYDEHGGYYDHVPPPEAVAPDGVPAHNYQLGLPSWLRRLLSPLFGRAFAELENIDAGPATYTRYGFRVPAAIVSPYARPGYLCRGTFDHTSVLKLIEQKWNLPPLTHRDAAAASPLEALDLDAPPAFATPPRLPEPLRPGAWTRS